MTLCRAGLAFDPWDVQFYTQLFRSAGRNPTNVECFDIAQSNRWGCPTRGDPQRPTATHRDT